MVHVIAFGILVISLSAAVIVSRAQEEIVRVPRTLHEDQCEKIVRKDCLNKPQKLRNSRFICVQLTDEELLKMLKDIGGYNPRYVALDQKGVKEFKDPRKCVLKPEPPKPQPTRAGDCTTTTPITPTPTRPSATPTATRQLPQRRFDPSMENIEDESSESSDMKTNGRVKRAISESVIGCTDKGSFVDNSNKQRMHMCSECRVVRHLDADVIPRFINEAACKHRLPAYQSSETNSCVSNTGLCEQKILTFPALKRSGYVRDRGLSRRLKKEVYVENWVEFTQQIRASCQCQVHTPIKQLLDGILSS